MLTKFTNKTIKEIREATNEKLKGLQVSKFNNYYVGYYRKPSANWAYMVYIIEDNGILKEVVTTFGEII